MVVIHRVIMIMTVENRIIVEIEVGVIIVGKKDIFLEIVLIWPREGEIEIETEIGTVEMEEEIEIGVREVKEEIEIEKVVIEVGGVEGTVGEEIVEEKGVVDVIIVERVDIFLGIVHSREVIGKVHK